MLLLVLRNIQGTIVCLFSKADNQLEMKLVSTLRRFLYLNTAYFVSKIRPSAARFTLHGNA